MTTRSGASAPPPAPRAVAQLGYRIALVLTALLALGVVVAVPLALRSLVGAWFSEWQPTLYDLRAMAPVAPVAAVPPAADRSDVTLAIVKLDPMLGQATLAVSGDRVCPTRCPGFTATFFALDDNAAERRGVPPSVTLTIAPTDLIFSKTITLPVRGQPGLYPFDAYTLWLGMTMLMTEPTGQPISVDRAFLTSQASITLENQDASVIMAPPTWIDPARVNAASGPYQAPMVVDLRFDRPDYLKILAVVLIALIAVSGAMAVATRGITDLVLGIGGFILGVWGIRAVLINQPLPGVSAIDVALSFVILFLLFGLTLRVLGYLHQRSNWSWPRGDGPSGKA